MYTHFARSCSVILLCALYVFPVLSYGKGDKGLSTLTVPPKVVSGHSEPAGTGRVIRKIPKKMSRPVEVSEPGPAVKQRLAEKIYRYRDNDGFTLQEACEEALKGERLDQIWSFADVQTGGEDSTDGGGLQINFKASIKHPGLGFVLNLDGGMDKEQQADAEPADDGEEKPAAKKEKKGVKKKGARKKVSRTRTAQLSEPEDTDNGDVAAAYDPPAESPEFVASIGDLQVAVEPGWVSYFKNNRYTYWLGWAAGWIFSGPKTLKQRMWRGFNFRYFELNSYVMPDGKDYMSLLGPVTLDNGDTHNVYVLQEINATQKGEVLSGHKLKVYTKHSSAGDKPRITEANKQFEIDISFAEFFPVQNGQGGQAGDEDETAEPRIIMSITAVAGIDDVVKPKPVPASVRRSSRRIQTQISTDEVDDQNVPKGPERTYQYVIGLDDGTKQRLVKTDDQHAEFKVRPLRPGETQLTRDGVYTVLNPEVIQEMVVRYLEADTSDDRLRLLKDDWHDGEMFRLKAADQFQHTTPGFPIFWMSRSQGSNYLPHAGGRWARVDYY